MHRMLLYDVNTMQQRRMSGLYLLRLYNVVTYSKSNMTIHLILKIKRCLKQDIWLTNELLGALYWRLT